MASDVSQRAREALPADVVALVCAARQILERGYVSTSIADEKPDADALDAALEAFSSRVCYDDEGGTLPEAHADPCTCLATIDNHPLTPKPVDDRGMGVCATQADREAATAIRITLYRACPDMPSYPDNIVPEIIARHREQAERPYKDAIKLIRVEAERENGGWVHLKRAIGVAARKALDTRP